MLPKPTFHPRPPKKKNESLPAKVVGGGCLCLKKKGQNNWDSELAGVLNMFEKAYISPQKLPHVP